MPQATCITNLVKISLAIFELCEQSLHKETNRNTHHNILGLPQGQVKNTN